MRNLLDKGEKIEKWFRISILQPYRTFKIEAQFEEKLMIIDITLSWKLLEFQ